MGPIMIPWRRDVLVVQGNVWDRPSFKTFSS